jgi:hypothetical protein
MQSIQSIICFNGGSAGDFLAGMCSEQLLGKSTYQIRANGILALSSTFKGMTKANYYNDTVPDNLENTLPVENTHFYLDYYPEIAHQLFYIDYPDHIARDIVQIFMLKRFNDDPALLADFIKQNYTEPLRSKITSDNILDVCKINWLKNVRSWRNNPTLKPLYLKDYFDQSSFYHMVETVCQCDIQNHDALALGYSDWISKNTRLKQLFL